MINSEKRLTCVLVGDPPREAYIVFWRPGQYRQVLRTFGRWACNADLSFDWHDAAKAAKVMRENLAASVQ